MFWKGKWRWCVVDDWVPVNAHMQPRFIRSRTQSELWMMILEKGETPSPPPLPPSSGGRFHLGSGPF
jgi:hypothetical protein